MITNNIPSGTKLAAYIRVSSDLQETDSQRAVIKSWAEKNGLTILFWFEDSEGRNPRDQAAKRKQFQQLLRSVEAGLVDTILVDRQDRFGTKDAWELGHFFSMLKKHGAELWSVSQGLLSGDDDTTVITSTLGAITSRREQKEKAHRNTRGMISTAAKGQYTGGYAAFGLDVVCFDTDGKEKWRVVFVGHFQRIKLWPDGTEERFDGKNNFPARDKNDILKVRPSIHKERLKTVRQMFAWYAEEDISERQIATRLKELGADPVYHNAWQHQRIKSMLANPVYIGLPTWNKQGGSRFVEYIDGEIREVKDTRQGRKRDETDFVQPEAPEFKPIVEIELWNKVQAKRKRIRESLTPAQRKKPPRSEAHWLSGFLYCAKCGRPMRTMRATGTPRLAPNYFCPTYGDYGRPNPTGCRCHRVKAELLHAMVETYLEEVGQESLELRSTPADMLKLTAGFYRSAAGAADELGDLAEQVREVITSVSKAEARKFIREHASLMKRAEKNTLTLDDVRKICSFVDRRSSDVGKEIEKLEAELDEKTDRYMTCPQRAKERAKAELDEVADRLDRLQSQAEGLVARYDRLRTSLEQFEHSAKAAQAACKTSQHRRKAELLKEVISRIDLTFRYTKKNGEPTAKKSFLDRVEIYPVNGPAVCFTNGNSEAQG